LLCESYCNTEGVFYMFVLKDVTVAPAAETVKSALTAPRIETAKPAVSECTVSANSVSGLLSTTSDNQWNVPGLLLSAAAQVSSQNEQVLDKSNAFSRAATSVLPVVVSSGLSGLIGLASGTIMSSSTLVPVDPAQLNLLLSQKVLVPVDPVKASHLAAGTVSKFSSEGDEAVLCLKADNITSDSRVRVEDAKKRTADEVDSGISKYSHLSTHDYTSIGEFNGNEFAVSWSKKAETDKAVHVKDASVSSDSRSFNKLTVNTDAGSLKFLPAQGMANCYPAIHQVLQRNNPKVADMLEKETVQSSKLSYRRIDGSHNATCIDEACTGCRRWTVSDADRFVRPQQHDYAAMLQERDAFLWRQDSSGFENSDRNPLALLQEVAEAVDTRGSPMSEVDDCNDLSHDSAFPVPALPGLHHKFRRKNRPEPLVIPAPVTHFGFQSRLRSPRVVADQPVAPLPVSQAPQPPVAATSGSVFMPYTPPPMLSPLRTGSGLFCSLVQPSPKSAPVGLRLGLIRSSKSGFYLC
jgi:hypothetical protein